MLQKFFKWLPLILLIFLFIIDRHNPLHVALYIAILLTYSGILVLKILYTKELWHKEFDHKIYDDNGKLEKLSDVKEKMFSSESNQNN